jgi:hypothetical protein
VIFYCKAGVRSTNASQIAKEAGYTKYVPHLKDLTLGLGIIRAVLMIGLQVKEQSLKPLDHPSPNIRTHPQDQFIDGTCL